MTITTLAQPPRAESGRQPATTINDPSGTGERPRPLPLATIDELGATADARTAELHAARRLPSDLYRATAAAGCSASSSPPSSAAWSAPRWHGSAPASSSPATSRRWAGS